MATITKYPVSVQAAGGVFNGAWTGAVSTVQSDNAVYATAAPGKNQEFASMFRVPFDTTEVPAGATINSVLVEVQAKVSTTSSVETLMSTLFADSAQTTPIGAAPALTSTTLGLTDFTYSYTRNPTEAQVRDLWVRVQAARGNTNTAFTMSLDFVRVTVDYTAAVGPTYVDMPVTMAGVGTVAASFKAEPRLAVVMAGAGSVAVVLKAEPRLAVVMAGVGTLASPFSAEPRFAATMDGVATVAATVTAGSGVTYVDLAATLAGAATLAASIRPEPRFAVALAGAGTVAAALRAEPRLATLMAGAGSLAAGLRAEPRLAVVMAGAGTLAGTLRAEPRFSVVLAGAATLAGAVNTEIRLSALLAGTASLSATLRPEPHFEALLWGYANIVTALTVTINGEPVPVEIPWSGRVLPHPHYPRSRLAGRL